MKLRVVVTKKTDSEYQQQKEIQKFPIFFGREEKNEVVLPDPQKRISRSHAKIIETNGLLQLIDLGSANFTYLNDEKIFPNEECVIKSGDKIKIGDYEIDLEMISDRDTKTFDDQKTMIFASPFADELESFANEFKKLTEKYLFDASPGKEEMLRFSVMQILGSQENNEGARIISEFFAHKFLEQSGFSGNIDFSSKVSTTKISSPVKPKSPEPIKTSVPLSSDSTHDYSFSSHFSQTVDLVLENLIKLIQAYLQFRQEFFGVTIYHTIPTGSLKEIKEYLFNPDISSEEQNKRISMIKEEAQKLFTHQVGLLEGYKASVTEGSQSLLQSLDPELIEKEAERKQASGFQNLLPYSKKLKTLETINETYKKYITDPYHLEKKFFRPAFIKGYQKRISSRNDKNEY
jgi:hypothetical protein